MEILKFGGTSISSYKSLQNILMITNELKEAGQPFVIVVSALEGVTDKLNEVIKLITEKNGGYEAVLNDIFKIHYRLVNALLEQQDVISFQKHFSLITEELFSFTKESYLNGLVSKVESDKILAYGELLSANLITRFLNSGGSRVSFLDTRRVILTDEKHGNADVNLSTSIKNIIDHWSQNVGDFVATGFIGATPGGTTTTLGRGGSDYTAAIFAIALSAESVTKWTDVNGVMTADPKISNNPETLDRISFEELLHLSKCSSNVLVHNKAIELLAENNIPLIVRNTFNTQFRGTVIGAEKNIYF
ncbi:MAG: aspartate kinase [Cytophagales bacterium]|nr:aspartate kinase [Cytophagales bacterium]